jgi:hypothetical protein
MVVQFVIGGCVTDYVGDASSVRIPHAFVVGGAMSGSTVSSTTGDITSAAKIIATTDIQATGGASVSGNYTSTNGNLTTTNGNVTATNGTVTGTYVHGTTHVSTDKMYVDHVAGATAGVPVNLEFGVTAYDGVVHRGISSYSEVGSVYTDATSFDCAYTFTYGDNFGWGTNVKQQIWEWDMCVTCIGGSTTRFFKSGYVISHFPTEDSSTAAGSVYINYQSDTTSYVNLHENHLSFHSGLGSNWGWFIFQVSYTLKSRANLLPTHPGETHDYSDIDLIY